MNVLIKLLVYGDPGAGKTWLCGTFTQCADTSPLLVLNSRGQSITFRQFHEDYPCIYDIRAMKDYNFPYMWIRAGQPWSAILRGVSMKDSPGYAFCQTVYDWTAERYGGSYDLDIEEGEEAFQFPPFKTIALDSLTQTQRVSLREITGSAGQLPGDVPNATNYSAWGKTLGQLTLLADKYFELPIHVVVTALRRHQFLESEGTTMYYPFFWGQSSQELPAYAEILGMLVNVDSLPIQQAIGIKQVAAAEGVDVPYNVMITRGGRLHRAKWQGVRGPPDLVPNPTAAKLLEIMRR